MKSRMGESEFERIRADTVPKYPYKGLLATSVLGCARSHIHAWNIVYSRGYDKALILEDDAIITREVLDQIDEYVIPDDCDIYLIGYTGMCDVNKSYEPYIHVLKPFLKMREFSLHSSGECFIPESFAGFHAYIITHKGAEKLKDTVITQHIDYQISNRLDVIVYAHTKNLVFQDMIDSNNIDSQMNLFDHIFTGRDRFNIPFNYILNSRFYGYVSTYHVIFLLCGFVDFSLILLSTLNPWYIFSYIVGRVVAILSTTM
jgi:GR25 family glycosyltransferase involved in LPS biosynthesis